MSKFPINICIFFKFVNFNLAHKCSNKIIDRLAWHTKELHNSNSENCKCVHRSNQIWDTLDKDCRAGIFSQIVSFIHLMSRYKNHN